MRHLKSGRKLSRRKNHLKAMLANLAVSLVKNDRIQTTDAKAKEVRIIKLGFRHVDNSPISLIEFVKEDEGKKTVKKLKPSKAQAKTKPSETPEKPVETAEVEEEAKEKDTEAEKTSPAEEKADNTEKPDDEIEDSGEEENKEKK